MKDVDNGSGLSLLLSVISSADEELTDAKHLVEQKLNKRSAIIKQLSEVYGLGPFEYNGSCVMIIKRGDTWFFRTKRGT